MPTPPTNPGDPSNAYSTPQHSVPPPVSGVSGTMTTALQRPANALMAPRTNGLIDYTVVLLLFLAPWVLSYSDHAVAPVSRALGALILFYSLCTKYELGVIRFIPLQVHLFLDLGMAVLLGAAPLHFAIWGLPGLMMVVLGLAMGAAALLTRHGQKFTRPPAEIKSAAEAPITTAPPTNPNRL
jgi:hypothetical protein